MKIIHQYTLPFLIIAIFAGFLIGCSSGEDNTSSDVGESDIFDTPGIGVGDSPSTGDDTSAGGDNSNSGSGSFPASLSSIRFDYDTDTLILKENATYKLNVLGVFTDNSTENYNDKVTWNSSDPSVLELGSNGSVSAKNIGSAQITVSYSSLASISLNINVEARLISSVYITPRPQVDGEKLAVSDSFDTQFFLKARYDNGTEDVLTEEVTWTCEDPSGDSLINWDTGEFTPYDSTSDDITISAEYGDYDDSISVYIDDNLILDSIELKIYRGTRPGEDEHPYILSVVEGQSANVIAIATYRQNGDEILVDITNSVTWTLNSEDYAGIEQDGTITAKLIAGDSQNVFVDIDNFEGNDPAAVRLTINKKELTGIQFSEGYSDVVTGSQFQLSATATYNNGTSEDLTESGSNSPWDSSNARLEVNSSDHRGFVTAVSAGSASIRVKKCLDGGDSCYEDEDEYMAVEKSITVSEQTLSSIAILTTGTSKNAYQTGYVNVDLNDPLPKGLGVMLTVMGYYDEGPVSEMDLSKDGNIKFSMTGSDLRLCEDYDSTGDRTHQCWVKAATNTASETISAQYINGSTTIDSNTVSIDATDDALVLFDVRVGNEAKTSLVVLEGQSKQLQISKEFSNGDAELSNATSGTGVTWSFADDGMSFSESSNKVSIDNDGWITGIEEGTLVLKASLDGYQGVLTREVSIEVVPSVVTLGEWYTGKIDAEGYIDLSVNIEIAGDYTFTFISQEKDNLHPDDPGRVWFRLGTYLTSSDYCALSHEHPRITIRFDMLGGKAFGIENVAEVEGSEETEFSLRVTSGGDYLCN
jgi:Big-like domain-containing protein